MTSSAPVWPAELFKDLDRNGPVPLYFQVAQCLEDGIRDGVLPPGTRLEKRDFFSQAPQRLPSYRASRHPGSG